MRTDTLRTLSTNYDGAYLAKETNLFSLNIFAKKAESEMLDKMSHRTSEAATQRCS